MVGVWLGVLLPEAVWLGVTLAVSDTVGELEGVEEKDGVLEGVGEKDGVFEGVFEGVLLALGVTVRELDVPQETAQSSVNTRARRKRIELTKAPPTWYRYKTEPRPRRLGGTAGGWQALLKNTHSRFFTPFIIKTI